MSNQPTPTISGLADQYARLSPHFEKRHQIAWRHAADYYARRADDIRKRIAVIPVDIAEPYPDAETQAEYLRNSVFHVSTMHCDHPVWTPAENLNYRIVHDVIGHGAGPIVHPFTVEGEILAWQRQLRDLMSHNADPMVIAASFTETVGQLAYAAMFHDFHPGQPIGFLDPMYSADVIDDRHAEQKPVKRPRR